MLSWEQLAFVLYIPKVKGIGQHSPHGVFAPNSLFLFSVPSVNSWPEIRLVKPCSDGLVSVSARAKLDESL